MNLDKEVRHFLQKERKLFKEKERETAPGLKEEKVKKRKRKAEDVKTRYKQLKEK